MKTEFNTVKFKKIANILRNTMNVFYWISLIGLIISVIAIPALLLITHGDLTVKHLINMNGSFSFQLDAARGISLLFPSQTIPADADLTRVIVSIIGTLF